jgi:hypothetical protein
MVFKGRIIDGPGRKDLTNESCLSYNLQNMYIMILDQEEGYI